MSNQIEIGDTTYTVQRFSVRKALRAGHLLTEILQQMPDIQQEVSRFTREYREENKLRVNRATAELRWPEQVARVSEEAWTASDGYVEIPADPSIADIAGWVFPRVFDAAEEKAKRLLALLVTPNSELGRAARDGNEDELLDGKADALMDEDAAELAELIVLAGDVLSEQFEGKAARLRAMASRFGTRSSEPNQSETEAETETESNGSKPSTSIASPSPTDGPSERSSIASPSEPSPASSG